MTESASSKPSFQQTFAALKHRNFRYWFWGQMVSLFGTWMQMTAQGFLVYQLTHSSAYLGYVGFASGAPSWLFMMYGGVIADRISKRTLLIVTQLSMMILAFVLAGLTYSQLIEPWQILALSFGLGLANAFDAPARMAFVTELVDKKDITNAVALNAMMFNIAIVIGPALAGLTYAAFGPSYCFGLNGISFIAVIAALVAIQAPEHDKTKDHRSVFESLKEGVRYVRYEPIIRSLVVLVAVTSLFGMSLGTLLPAWSVKVFHGDAATNGILFSARGIGSLIGSLAIAMLGRTHIHGKLILAGAFLYPIFIVLFTSTTFLPNALVLMGLLGAASIFVINLSNATIQTLVPDALRGRVMGVFSTTFMGSIPIGALFLGTIAEYAGEANAALLSSVIAFCAAIAIWHYVPKLRQIE